MAKFLSDNDEMPFGRFKGMKMIDIPADYLDDLSGTSFLATDWPEVQTYIEMNAAHIRMDLALQTSTS